MTSRTRKRKEPTRTGADSEQPQKQAKTESESEQKETKVAQKQQNVRACARWPEACSQDAHANSKCILCEKQVCFAHLVWLDSRLCCVKCVAVVNNEAGCTGHAKTASLRCSGAVTHCSECKRVCCALHTSQSDGKCSKCSPPQLDVEARECYLWPGDCTEKAVPVKCYCSRIVCGNHAQWKDGCLTCDRCMITPATTGGVQCIGSGIRSTGCSGSSIICPGCVRYSCSTHAPMTMVELSGMGHRMCKQCAQHSTTASNGDDGKYDVAHEEVVPSATMTTTTTSAESSSSRSSAAAHRVSKVVMSVEDG